MKPHRNVSGLVSVVSLMMVRLIAQRRVLFKKWREVRGRSFEVKLLSELSVGIGGCVPPQPCISV